MPIMIWDKSLDIGVAPMNAEHQDILRVMNQIYDAREKGQHGSTINLLVAELGEIEAGVALERAVDAQRG